MKESQSLRDNMRLLAMMIQDAQAVIVYNGATKEQRQDAAKRVKQYETKLNEYLTRLRTF